MYKKDGIVYYDNGSPCLYQGFNSDYLKKLPDAPGCEQPKINPAQLTNVEASDFIERENKKAILKLAEEEEFWRKLNDNLENYSLPDDYYHGHDDFDEEHDPEHTYHASTAKENNGIIINIDFMDDESYDAIKKIADRRGVNFIDVIWAAIRYYINKDKSRHKKKSGE